MKKLSPSLIWRHQDSSGEQVARDHEQQYPGAPGRTHVCVPAGPAWRQGGLGGSLGQVRQEWATVCAGEAPTAAGSVPGARWGAWPGVQNCCRGREDRRQEPRPWARASPRRLGWLWPACPDLAPAASLPGGGGPGHGVAPWAPPASGWPALGSPGVPTLPARRVCEAAQQLWGDPPGAAGCARGYGFPLRPVIPGPALQTTGLGPHAMPQRLVGCAGS